MRSVRFSHQFRNRIRVVHQLDWPPREVGQGRGRVDAEKVIKGGVDVLQRGTAALGAFGVRVGGTNGLPHFQSAGQARKAGDAPVFPTRPAGSILLLRPQRGNKESRIETKPRPSAGGSTCLNMR